MTTKEEILGTFNSKEGAWFAYNEGIRVGYNTAYNSLRNQAAIAAMQGLLSNSAMRLEEGDTYPKVAVMYANALVEELKKK